MIRGLGEIRLGALSLALLAGLSCAATVLIISGGSGRSAAQLAALAALRQRPVVIAAHGSAAGSAIAERAGAGSGARNRIVLSSRGEPSGHRISERGRHGSEHRDDERAVHRGECHRLPAEGGSRVRDRALDRQL